MKERVASQIPNKITGYDGKCLHVYLSDKKPIPHFVFYFSENQKAVTTLLPGNNASCKHLSSVASYQQYKNKHRRLLGLARRISENVQPGKVMGFAEI